MELESTNLINITNSKNDRIMEAFSYEKDIKQLMRFLQKILGLINIFLIILFFTIFVLDIGINKYFFNYIIFYNICII